MQQDAVCAAPHTPEANTPEEVSLSADSEADSADGNPSRNPGDAGPAPNEMDCQRSGRDHRDGFDKRTASGVRRESNAGRFANRHTANPSAPQDCPEWQWRSLTGGGPASGNGRSTGWRVLLHLRPLGHG